MITTPFQLCCAGLLELYLLFCIFSMNFYIKEFQVLVPYRDHIVDIQDTNHFIIVIPNFSHCYIFTHVFILFLFICTAKWNTVFSVICDNNNTNIWTPLFISLWRNGKNSIATIFLGCSFFSIHQISNIFCIYHIKVYIIAH